MENIFEEEHKHLMTILVVDDSRLMRNIVKNHISELNIAKCTYIEAENGEDAFNLVQTNQIDLALIDWNMPKMSGIDLLKQIRNMEQYKKLPIIMVTANADRTSVLEALENGVTDYIIKPIDEKIFREKLTCYINNIMV